VNSLAGPTRAAPPTISVVIPTLNEAAELPETLRRARAIPEVCEIIVVDGGSRDDTRELAAGHGCAVLTASAGRGGQLRLGASRAKGELVLLLHADTWLPPEAGEAAIECCRRPDVVGGGFWKVFRDPSWVMRGARARCWLRLRLGRRILGDQAMFIRREILERIGGVPDMPLMEDVELCRRLRPLGHLVLADATVVTSARRFRNLGVLRTYWRMWTVGLRYRLGATPEELRRLYEKE
jgi:rSAM/selenodomain-associated transferase 2